MDDLQPRRRWFRISLLALLVVVLLLCTIGVWVAFQRDWIRQRHAFIAQVSSQKVDLTGIDLAELQRRTVGLPQSRDVEAPWPLRWFGETECPWLSVPYLDSSPEAERARRLFPEAVIISLPPKASGSESH